jgi:hypothetical protein
MKEAKSTRPTELLILTPKSGATMTGKGELVEYTRLDKKAPLTQADKDELKAKINALIDNATLNVTIEMMVKAKN